MAKYVIPKTVKSEDIKMIRNILGMTQKEFAEFTNVSKRTVERWESTDEDISGPITVLLDMLIKDLELPEKLSIPGKKYRMRLWYMYHDFVCTIIDVDEAEQRVQIQNYFRNPIYRAFGVNTEPTYEDYQEFIKSRCFPESRDKLKLELKKLDIPFYDPIMIIEKTQGRMAEDDFWIRIEW